MVYIEEAPYTIGTMFILLILTVFVCLTFYALYSPPFVPAASTESQEVENLELIPDPGYQMLSPHPLSHLPIKKYRDLPIFFDETDAYKHSQTSIVLTDEPYTSDSRELEKTFDNGKKILFINAYTRLIYASADLLSPNGPPLDGMKIAELASRKLKNVPAVSFFGTYRPEAFTTKYHDLKDRQDLALKGKEMGHLRIYGNMWPFKVEHNSRTLKEQERYRTVVSILRDEYAFNLCSENTQIENYITEKIWQAIEGHTLPVYRGGNGIENYFPENSFVDVNKFGTAEELFYFLRNMTVDEYKNRIMLCVQAFNDRRNTSKREGEKMKARIIAEMDRFASSLKNN